MKSLFFAAILLSSLFAFSNTSNTMEPTCDSQMGFEITEPIYTGDHTLWMSLKILADQGTFVQPQDADIQRAGLCILNVAKTAQPDEALAAPTAAILTKKGEKLFVLFYRDYNLNLPAYAYDEKACLKQVETLHQNSNRFLTAPAEKVSYEYKNNFYFLNVSTQIFPIQYEVKKSGNNYIVKKDSFEYCVFAANPK